MKTFPLSPIVNLLRDELAAYGGLLAAFERQQGHLLNRRVDEATAESETIQDLVAESAECRGRREAWVVDFARQQQQLETVSLKALLPFFPAEQVPLLEALIKEINHLIHRVRRRVRQNHGLLARELDLHHELRRQLQGEAEPPRTYAASGRVAELSGPAGLRATG